MGYEKNAGLNSDSNDSFKLHLDMNLDLLLAWEDHILKYGGVFFFSSLYNSSRFISIANKCS